MAEGRRNPYYGFHTDITYILHTGLSQPCRPYINDPLRVYLPTVQPYQTMSPVIAKERSDCGNGVIATPIESRNDDPRPCMGLPAAFGFAGTAVTVATEFLPLQGQHSSRLYQDLSKK